MLLKFLFGHGGYVILKRKCIETIYSKRYIHDLRSDRKRKGIKRISKVSIVALTATIRATYEHTVDEHIDSFLNVSRVLVTLN